MVENDPRGPSKSGRYIDILAGTAITCCCDVDYLVEGGRERGEPHMLKMEHFVKAFDYRQPEKEDGKKAPTLAEEFAAGLYAAGKKLFDEYFNNGGATHRGPGG